MPADALKDIFPLSWQLGGERIAANADVAAASYPRLLDRRAAGHGLPSYLGDLARIEWHLHEIAGAAPPTPAGNEGRTVNPALELLRLSWRRLPDFFTAAGGVAPEPGEEFVLVWLPPGADARPRVEEAGPEDLLALKLVAENIPLRQAAADGNSTVGALDSLLARATARGLIQRPPSGINRASDFFCDRDTQAVHQRRPWSDIDEKFLSSPVFTLQWHITQACDLHCRHCYDRSSRRSPGLDQATRVLDELFDFCQRHHVHGQISFTGGNPFLYPHFPEVYRRAGEMGFLTAILGNPVPRDNLQKIVELQQPEFYQISLEGLEKHNDFIRGTGHFKSALAFLDTLREMGVYSMVMLTLTQDNQDQVLPLAELLRQRADLFTFNRLAATGEGGALAMAPVAGYEEFLEAYELAARDNPVMAMKDSLFNIQRRQRRQRLLGGCAGHGCGAAFNFVSLLPDGEVHACRKFPSPLGNIRQQGLHDIYHSETAAGFRRGSSACAPCPVRPVCGGCLAVTATSKRQWWLDRDPYCFMPLTPVARTDK